MLGYAMIRYVKVTKMAPFGKTTFYWSAIVSVHAFITRASSVIMANRKPYPSLRLVPV